MNIREKKFELGKEAGLTFSDYDEDGEIEWIGTDAQFAEYFRLLDNEIEYTHE